MTGGTPMIPTTSATSKKSYSNIWVKTLVPSGTPKNSWLIDGDSLYGHNI